MNHRYLPIVFLIVVFFILALYSGYCQNGGCAVRTSSAEKFRDYQRISAIANGKKLEVEVVISPEAQAQGLSGRDQIGVDGMLFIFDSPRVAVFWMKEMKFDIDMVWIKNARVVGVVPAVPYPRQVTPLDQLPTYSSSTPIDMVLEVAAGQAAAWGLQPGTMIELES